MKDCRFKYISVFFFLIIAVCNIFCNKKSDTFRQLESIESLFSENKDSVVAKEFEKIIPPVDSSADLALYNYLYAKLNIRNHKILPSNCLDYSIAFFESNKDSLHLAYSYNYKSMFLLNNNDKKSAREYNLMAEKISTKLNNKILNYNIYSEGYFIAAYYYDTDECLSYANKAYLMGQKLGDTKRMAYPAVYLTMCYNDKNIADSVKKYMAVCLNFINDYDCKTKSTVYNVFGNVLSNTDNVMAERYFLESISIRHNADAYNGLTKLYLKFNKLEKADTCFQKALRPKAYEANIELMKMYAEKLESTGNLSKAVKIRRQLSMSQDSLFEEKTAGLNCRINVLNGEKQQAKTSVKNLENNLFIFRILSGVLMLIATVSVYFIYKLKKREYIDSEYIEETENENDSGIGKMLYEKIINTGENISQLKKEQRLPFIKYYETIDSEYMENIKETYDYKRLSVNALIVLILQHIDKDKNFIINVMGFSDQALRSLKSRTEKLRKCKVN